jgi:hypothetical protein
MARHNLACLFVPQSLPPSLLSICVGLVRRARKSKFLMRDALPRIAVVDIMQQEPARERKTQRWSISDWAPISLHSHA